MINKKIGLTIGKFAPLHKGHQYLIETALEEMDEVYCVIYDTDIIDIDVKNRAKWINRLYPDVKILFAYKSPKQYGLDVESVNIQIDYLKKIIKNIPVTHFYSSELYGEKVADILNIKNRIVDLKREKFPIAGTILRKDFKSKSNFLEKFILDELSVTNTS